MPTHNLYPLLDHLAAARPTAETWQGWRIRRISGGHNGLVYRATGAEGDVAVKFTQRDARDRAGREYHALQALRRLGLDLAPEPLLLERERYAHPVVVQTWLEGAVSPGPPEDDAGWEQLRRHYAAIHTVAPSAVETTLPPAVFTAARAEDALAHVERETARLPRGAWPAGLRELVAEVEGIRRPSWPAPPTVLCRVDPNPLNLIRRPGPWASVDWENSGWGDPAFEIANLMAFPAYGEVPAERRQWLVEGLFDRTADPSAPQRVHTYYVLTLAWWVAVFARLRYEVEHGGEAQRMVPRPAGWREGLPQQYQCALKRAWSAL